MTVVQRARIDLVYYIRARCTRNWLYSKMFTARWQIRKKKNKKITFVILYEKKKIDTTPLTHDYIQQYRRPRVPCARVKKKNHVSFARIIIARSVNIL